MDYKILLLNEKGRGILATHEEKRITPHLNHQEMVEKIAYLARKQQEHFTGVAIKQSDFN